MIFFIATEKENVIPQEQLYFLQLWSVLRSFLSVWMWRDHKVDWKCLYVFWATFFILYIRLPCSSHKWRRSIPSLIGNFHSDLRAIYLLRDLLIPGLIMLSLQQGIRSWNIVTFLLESIVHSLHSIYFFYWWKYAHIIVHPHFRIIVHFNYSFPYSALSFSAYFSVNWLAQNSKLASGSGDT